MQASWYSVQSLKNEGTYKYSKGVMANGTKANRIDLNNIAPVHAKTVKASIYAPNQSKMGE